MVEVIKKIIKLASDLDNKGLIKEADLLDGIVIQMSDELFPEEEGCHQELDDELYYLENLSDMHGKMEQENDAQDLVDT